MGNPNISATCPIEYINFTPKIFKKYLDLKLGSGITMRITQRISNLQEAVSDSDIIITITPSHTPLIQKEWVKPGTHFSCIGADMAGKEEIDSQIFEDAIVFVDDLEHCRNAGEIEIPLKQGTLSEDRICGELGDLILGKAAGRKSDTDITVFDSTGMALLDLAVADFLLKKNR